MKCPFCGDIGDKVVDSRESREGDVIRRRRQCLLVDQTAASGVDDERARPHQLQLCGADHAASRPVERHVQRHDVGLGKQLIERHRSDAMRAIELGIVADVVREHAAIEWREQSNEILSHEAAANDPNGSPSQLTPNKFPPVSTAQAR